MLTPLESQSQAVKLLKLKYVLQAINQHKMDQVTLLFCLLFGFMMIGQAIIFCRTKVDCDNLEDFLNGCGGGKQSMTNEYSCTCVHSDRAPDERRDNLQKFKV